MPSDLAAGRWQKYARPEATDSFQTAQPVEQLVEQPVEQPVNQGVDAPLYVMQRANRGLADVLGAPVDLTAAGINLGLMGADKLARIFGGSVDTRIENPVLGSDWIADKASEAYEAAGGNVVPPEAVSPGVRTVGTGARGAAAALVPAFGLASGPVQTAVQAGRGGSLLQGLAKPYASGVGPTLARDAAAGFGAGAGAQGFDDYAPEWVQDSMAAPFLKALAALVGGVGGAGAVSIGEGLAKGAGNTVRNIIRGSGDPDAPINPATGAPFTRTEMDRAAYIAQQMPTNRSQAIANIDEGARDFASFAGPSQTPTVGMLADDIGMASSENVLRSRDPRRFMERDAARRALASDKVDATAPPGADGRAFTGAATAQYDDALRAAQAEVDDVLARQAQFQKELADQKVQFEEFRARQPEVSAAMAEDFDIARRAARETKNALYDAVDPATPVRGDFIKRALDEIDAVRPEAEKLAGGPYSEISRRVRSLVETIDPKTGEALPKDITYGDLKALRAQVSEARRNAVAASGQSVAGSGADVERLDQLSRVLGHLADEINPEAAKFYREQYAPRFKQGRAGEYGAAMDRAVRTGGESSATRPSEFGEKFLRRPEDAASFRRAMEPLPTDQKQLSGTVGDAASAGIDEVTARNAKEWMLGDLAKSGVLTDNAEIRYNRFKQWVDRNRQTIDQFPDLAKTVDDELARAQRGGALSRQLADEIAEAKRNLKMTEQELRRSALQSAIGNSPENAVASIMGSGDPEKRMAEMVTRLQGNTEATDGLKAAVRDWIKDKAGTTGDIVGQPDATRLSRANLRKLFNKHENTLAKIYSPEEMNALRQAHKLMAAEAKLDVRATAGSNTFDKAQAAQRADIVQRKRVLEGALKAKFGVLKGGGIFRTINIFLESLPDGARGLEDILFEMHFNPELAKHLLTRPVKDIGSPAWNSKLNKLLAVATGARESVEGDGDQKRP